MEFFQPALATGDNIETTIINALVNSGLQYIDLDGNTWGQVKLNWHSRPGSLQGLPDDPSSIIGFDAIRCTALGLLIRAPSLLTIQHPSGTVSEVRLPCIIKPATNRKDATKIIRTLCNRFFGDQNSLGRVKSRLVRSLFPPPVCHLNNYACILHKTIAVAVSNAVLLAEDLAEGEELDKRTVGILFSAATDENMKAMGLDPVRVTVVEAPCDGSSGGYVLLMSYKKGWATIMRSDKMCVDVARVNNGMLGLPDVSEETLKENRPKYFALQHAHNSRLSASITMGNFRRCLALKFRALVEAVEESLPANHELKGLIWLDFTACLNCFTVGAPLGWGGLEATWMSMGLDDYRETVRKMIRDGDFVVKFQGKEGERLKFLLKLRTGIINASMGVGKGFCKSVSSG
ncbi:hypothetical protein TrCOL_g12348 [Triparma columacea]|uniref:Uncharacterized protein n=1 Tax=Triparma columacea TaxID=722753 RepID=A0A9W7LFD2_9STRA|nr:hypothetical protein TrCOL_g12348 [Triparma columacea]